MRSKEWKKKQQHQQEINWRHTQKIIKTLNEPRACKINSIECWCNGLCFFISICPANWMPTDTMFRLAHSILFEEDFKKKHTHTCTQTPGTRKCNKHLSLQDVVFLIFGFIFVYLLKRMFFMFKFEFCKHISGKLLFLYSEYFGIYYYFYYYYHR